MTNKEYMIGFIRQHLYFSEGSLESMTEDEVREHFESLIDWIGD